MSDRVWLAIEPLRSRQVVIKGVELGVRVLQRGPEFLPDQGRRTQVGLIIDRVGQKEGMSGASPIVTGHKNSAGRQYGAGRRHDSRHCSTPRRTPRAEEPYDQHRRNRQAEDEPFEWSTVCENCDPRAQNHAVARTVRSQKSRKRAHNERSSGSSYEPSPIAIHPVTKNSEPQDHEHPTEQRPTGWKPPLKHPNDARAHGGCAEKHTNPRMAEKLTDRQNGTLGGRVLGHIRRMLVDVERVEVDPHWMGRIRKPAMSERIRSQQITELIPNVRDRYRKDRQQSDSQKCGSGGYQCH